MEIIDKRKFINYLDDPENGNYFGPPGMDIVDAKYPIIGSTDEMKEVFKQIVSSSHYDSDYPVLILGETGTGKELVARGIFMLYCRENGDMPFVIFDCGAYPETLIDAALFGHEKGAFTGATYKKEGLFRKANGGILFIDELGNAPQYLQQKILRAAEYKEIMPLGSDNNPVRTEARILAATNEDIHKAVMSGKIRKDFFNRFDVFEIDIPPLKKRKQDIPLLVDYFLGKHNKKFDSKRYMTPEALEIIKDFDWPYNVRELRNFIKLAAASSDDDVIGKPMVKSILDRKERNYNGTESKENQEPMKGFRQYSYDEKLPDYLRELDNLKMEIENRAFTKILEDSYGNITRAALKSGINVGNLKYFLRRRKIDASKFKPRRNGKSI